MTPLHRQETNGSIGFYTRHELNATEEEQVAYIGNVCAPTSVSVMNRVAVAYAHQRRFETWLQAQGLGDTEFTAAQEAARDALQDAVQDAADIEKEYARKLKALRDNVRSVPPGHVTTGMKATKAGQRWMDDRRKEEREASQRLAKARQRVVERDRQLRYVSGDPKVASKRPSRSAAQRKSSNALVTMLVWMTMVAAPCITAAMCIGTQVGVGLAADALKNGVGSKRVALRSASQDHILHRCYAAFSNRQAKGMESETSPVKSTLWNTKENKAHAWNVDVEWVRKAELATHMDKDPDNYSWGLEDLRPAKHPPYTFQLTDHNPVFKRQYHLAFKEQQWADEWVKKLEKAGIVKETRSPYAAPVVVAPKKDETGAWNDLRYAVDYRGLNDRTIRDSYPSPTAEEIMARMQGASLFSVMDAQKAFHQLMVSDQPSGPDGLSAQDRLAFHAGNRLMTFNRMPFGHKNSVAAWQRVMDDALAGIEFAAAYADDIIIWSGPSEEEHMRRIRVVLARLKDKGVQISPTKTRLGLKRAAFLGHIVSGDGIEPMHDKVEAIANLAPCKNPSDVRSFLGMATYYCKFLPSFSLVKAPLTALTKKGAEWRWGVPEQRAFEAIKSMLLSAQVLRHPDWQREFKLHTDWSNVGVGACLSQVDVDGIEYAIAYASKMNTGPESNYSAYEGEVGAVVWAVQRFRYYLYGHHWQLITDCKAMEWLKTTAKLRGKLARWSLILAEYDFDIKHRPGKLNTVPDYLSRQPVDHKEEGGVSSHICSHPMPTQSMRRYSQLLTALAFTAGVVEGSSDVWPTADIWDSPLAIAFVKGELTFQDVQPEVWATLTRKCAKYEWHNDKMWRLTGGRIGGMMREVPPPQDRRAVILRVHHSIGHLGRDRTYHVLARHYVWPGIHRDVSNAVRQCAQCDRVKATFNMKHDRMKPLPLFGLFYRFSVDSAGPFAPSKEGYKYVIVIVEHFSKWIELVPVRDLTSAATAQAFHERVLARYGAPVECVTDNGKEYQDAFSSQLERHGIEQVEIPPGHPQSNGMAERIVQVLKLGLRKVVPTLGTAMWHEWMPVIEFGYRVSKQASTGFSPYFLMYGRDHHSPEQVRRMMDEPVDMDDYASVINLLTERADVLRSAMPRAFERAQQAQRRDIIRYRKVRRGDVQPRRRRFEVGHYVYMSQPPLNTLDVKTTRTILRVKAVLDSGWLLLVGSDGREMQVHMDNCAPCHLSNLVPARHPGPSRHCRGCGSDSAAMPRLLCDKCGQSWHVECARVPIRPGEEWFCPHCIPPMRPVERASR